MGGFRVTLNATVTPKAIVLGMEMGFCGMLDLQSQLETLITHLGTEANLRLHGKTVPGTHLRSSPCLCRKRGRAHAQRYHGCILSKDLYPLTTCSVCSEACRHSDAHTSVQTRCKRDADTHMCVRPCAVTGRRSGLYARRRQTRQSIRAHGACEGTGERMRFKVSAHLIGRQHVEKSMLTKASSAPG